LSDELGKEDVAHGEASGNDEHQENWQVIVKPKRHLKHIVTNRCLFQSRNSRAVSATLSTRLRIIVQADATGSDQGCQATTLSEIRSEKMLIDREKMLVLTFS